MPRKKTGHGGKRVGAGRKPSDPSGLSYLATVHAKLRVVDLDALEELAKRSGVTVGEYLRRLIVDHLASVGAKRRRRA